MIKPSTRAKFRIVLAHTANGLNCEQIARAMGQSVNVIKNYRSRIQMRLGAVNMYQAITFAIVQGKIRVDPVTGIATPAEITVG